MSEKMPGDTKMGNDKDTGLEELGVHRVSSEQASDESEVLDDLEANDEESMSDAEAEETTVDTEEASTEDEATSEVVAADEGFEHQDASETQEDLESGGEDPDESSADIDEFGKDANDEASLVLGDSEKDAEGTQDTEVEDTLDADDLTDGESEEALDTDLEDLSDEELEDRDVAAGIAEPELSDDEATETIDEDAVTAVMKHSQVRAKKSRLAAGVRNVLGVLLLLWFAFIFVAPFVLPQGLDTPDLDYLTGDHFLGTDSVGRDQLSTVLRAGQTMLIYALIPTLVGMFGLLLTFKSWSDPSARQSRSRLMRPMPFTVVALILSFGLGLFLPRSWVYFIIVAFLALVLWLREAFSFARYMKAYRQAPTNQYSYYLGARELDTIRFTYGQEMRAAFANGLLNIFLRAYLIISVLPFADNSLMVPLRADWASQILLPLQQGRSLMEVDVLPHFVGWAFTLALILLLLFFNFRVAKHQTVLSPMRMRANYWRAGDEA